MRGGCSSCNLIHVNNTSALTATRYDAALAEAREACPWITDADAHKFADYFANNTLGHSVVAAFEQYMDFV